MRTAIAFAIVVVLLAGAFGYLVALEPPQPASRDATAQAEWLPGSD
jgi:hypothetical protein